MPLSTNTKVWLHGLAGAFIGALGSGISNIAIAPETFNLTTLHGAEKLLASAIISGLIAAGAYLSKSPVPSLPMEPGDTATLKNPVIAPDGTISGTSATLTKAVDPNTPASTLKP